MTSLDPTPKPESSETDVVTGTGDPPNYWRAQAFADTVLAEFEAARKANDLVLLRDRFYVLAAYYRRTLSILHSGLEHRREALVLASLENLIVLQRALSAMRRVAPDTAQSTLALENVVHRRVNRDLIYQIVRDARGPLTIHTILRRFNELDLIADAKEPAMKRALDELILSGHATEHRERYGVTHKPYVDTDTDRAGLVMLLGQPLARRFLDAGFEGLSQVLARREAFRELFEAETAFGSRAGTLVLAAAATLAPPTAALHGRDLQHADLSSSAHPRPYQRLLHAIFRAHRYAGQVIEAPAGSGKTLVGMMCIEDWWRTMAPGQSILVLVPTVNYQRQWVEELCMNDAGLRIPPSLVFSGTPAGLASSRRAGTAPVVLVLTYAGLARVASGVGKGGFDSAAVERFLQGNDIRHIILDEVHKVAADLAGAEAHVVGVFRDWLRDGSLSSLVGFSATLLGYRRQLASLGLDVAYVLQAKELIAQGWVASRAEFGAPFNYSEREREIATLIDKYRSLLKEYSQGIGAHNLRRWFRAIPLHQRERIAAMLGMYAYRHDADELITARLERWEQESPIGLNDLLLVSIVQIRNRWPDSALLQEAGETDRFESWAKAFEERRAGLRALLPPGRLSRLLSKPGFGDSLDSDAFAPREGAADLGADQAKELLATTFTGTYLALRTWSRQVGEGRVSIVRSIVAAERDTRKVSGVIVFDRPAPLESQRESAAPGFRGVGGMFTNLLGEPSLVPMAVLASAVYLPDGPDQPLHSQIADWIIHRVIGQAQSTAMFQLIKAIANLEKAKADAIHGHFVTLFELYVAQIEIDGTKGMSQFERKVLRPLREYVQEARLDRPSRLLLSSLSLDQNHLRTSVGTILDYAAIAEAFRAAKPVAAIQGSGRQVLVRVVPVPGGRRRQLFLDLTARIIDSSELPVNVIIVSDWARTGWNVITPNVLIDATATRNAVAWQQLSGRALRPAPGWSYTAQRLMHHLQHPNTDNDAPGDLDHFLASLPKDEVKLAQEVFGGAAAGQADWPSFRDDAAATLLLQRNKVTHVYELIRAYGKQPQVEYDSSDRSWKRSAAIARKHIQEAGVRPQDGSFVAGASHAPVIIASDPRMDSPGAFKSRLTSELTSVDERIVQGWLRAGSRSGITDVASDEATA